MSLIIRAMLESDVAAADKVFRLAFGTHFGLPDPLAFTGTARSIEFRRRTWPEGAFVAEKDGTVAGIAMSSRGGRVAVHPQQWRGGIAGQLLEATMPVYDQWQCRAAALFTFPASLTHVGLYQSFGFWTRSLTALMSRPVTAASPVLEARSLTAMG